MSNNQIITRHGNLLVYTVGQHIKTYKIYHYVTRELLFATDDLDEAFEYIVNNRSKI